MNAELFRKVADAIEKEPDNYRQSAFGLCYLGDVKARIEPCKTACCVAGWAAHIEEPGKGFNFNTDLIDFAQERLELTEEESDELFEGHWPIEWFEATGLDPRREGHQPWRATPSAEEAAVILRRMADEGRVILAPVKEDA